MPVEIITSLQNPRLKQLVRLRDRRPGTRSGRSWSRATARSGARWRSRWRWRSSTTPRTGFWAKTSRRSSPQAGRPPARASSSCRRTRSPRSPTASGPTASSPSRPNGGRTLGRPRPPRRSVPARRRGDREAGQPRHDPAQRRRGGLRRGDRVRPGDRPLQPERRPRLDRRPFLRAVRRRGKRRRSLPGSGAGDPDGRDHARGREESTPTRTCAARSPSSWAASNMA